MGAREMKVDDIIVGRRDRDQVLGTEGNVLRNSLIQQGLRRPIAVAPDGQLIDGYRRLTLLKQMGWRKVTVITVNSLQEAAELLISARAYSIFPSLPMNTSELARLGLTLEKLPRQRGRDNDHRIPIANALGLSTGTWQRIRTIAIPQVLPDFPAEERELSEKLLRQIDDGTTTASAALRAFQQFRQEAAGGPTQTAALTGEVAQRRAITQANTALSALLFGLEQIREFDVPSEELTTYMNEMARYRTQLAGFVRRMRKAVEES